MTVNSEQILLALQSYLDGSTGLPGNILQLLEDSDHTARAMAESVEGILGLYAAGMIAEDALKIQLRAIVFPQVQWGAALVVDSISGIAAHAAAANQMQISNSTLTTLSPAGIALGQFVGIGRASELA